MSDTYTEIYYHLVWTTKKREPMIVPEMELLLYRSLHASCRDFGVTVYALNAMPDHVHLACSLPTTIAVAALMHKIKGSAAHLINHLPEGRHALAWQPGYGALTFAQRELDTTTQYIRNQQKHHQNGTLSKKMERTATEWVRPTMEARDNQGPAIIKARR